MSYCIITESQNHRITRLEETSRIIESNLCTKTPLSLNHRASPTLLLLPPCLSQAHAAPSPSTTSLEPAPASPATESSLVVPGEGGPGVLSSRQQVFSTPTHLNRQVGDPSRSPATWIIFCSYQDAKPAQKHVCLSVNLSLRVRFILVCQTLPQISLSTSRYLFVVSCFVWFFFPGHFHWRYTQAGRAICTQIAGHHFHSIPGFFYWKDWE